MNCCFPEISEQRNQFPFQNGHARAGKQVAPLHILKSEILFLNARFNVGLMMLIFKLCTGVHF